jgi:hypothetical protein
MPVPHPPPYGLLSTTTESVRLRGVSAKRGDRERRRGRSSARTPWRRDRIDRYPKIMKREVIGQPSMIVRFIERGFYVRLRTHAPDHEPPGIRSTRYHGTIETTDIGSGRLADLDRSVKGR